MDGLTITDGYDDLLRHNGLTTVDAILSLNSVDRMTKPGLDRWRERCRIELVQPGGGFVVAYLKRYRVPPLRAQLARAWHGCVTHASAWIEWQWMHRLAAAGIPVVRPIALGERMRAGKELASFLMTDAAVGESLEVWARSRIQRAPRAMIERLADVVAHFHSPGYAHRDMYLSHIFFNDRAPLHDAFRFIDLQRVIQPTFHRRWVVKDLAALNYSTPARVASRTDRLRFLRRYLAIRDRVVTEPRPWTRPRRERPVWQTDDAVHGTRTALLPPENICSGSGLPLQPFPGLDRRRKSITRWLVDRILAKSNRMARHDQRRASRHATGDRLGGRDL